MLTTDNITQLTGALNTPTKPNDLTVQSCTTSSTEPHKKTKRKTLHIQLKDGKEVSTKTLIPVSRQWYSLLIAQSLLSTAQARA